MSPLTFFHSWILSICKYIRRILNCLKIKTPNCPCDVVKPILVVSQLVGILPVSLVRRDCFKSTGISLVKILATVQANSREDTVILEDLTSAHCCTFVYQRKSWPSVVNYAHFGFYSTVLVWVHVNMFSILRRYFHGTDLYALYFQIFTIYYEVLIVLGLTRWKSESFIEAWTKLTEVYKLLRSAGRTPPLARLKRQVFGLLAIMAVVTIWYMDFTYMWILKPCIVHSEQGGQPKCTILSGLFWQKFGHSLLVIFYQAFSVLFFTSCQILRLMDTEIAEWLKDEMRTMAVNGCSGRIGHVRRAHEKLCTTISLLSDFFGLPAITVICSIFVSVSLNIYKLLLADQTTTELAQSYYYIWGFHVYFGCFTLLINLLGGQMVKNLGGRPRSVIHQASYGALPEDLKFEVLMLLDQVKKMPTITAGGIADIGMNILASGVTSVATFLLVLLQFHFTVKPHDDDSPPMMTRQ